MQVKAIKEGFCKGLRKPGDVFEWPGLEPSAVPFWVVPLGPARRGEPTGPAQQPMDNQAQQEDQGAAPGAGEAALPEALSDGTRLDSLTSRKAIRDYAERTFGASPVWAGREAMLTELVDMDRAAEAQE
jgi:hypothetical protein